MIAFVLCIWCAQIANIRLCLVLHVGSFCVQHICVWPTQVAPFRSKVTCYKLWHRIWHWVSNTSLFSRKARFILLNGVLKERRLMSHLPIFWTCQVWSTAEIKLLARWCCISAVMCAWVASSLLIELKQFIDEVISCMACLWHCQCMGRIFKAVRLWRPDWKCSC